MKKFIVFIIILISFPNQNLFGQNKSTNTNKKETQEQITTKRKATLTSKETGCTCGWLRACADFDCGPWCGFCADSSGKACSICDCKTGGLAHCTNWADIINDPNCADLKDEYCHGGPSGNTACNNDPVCNM